MLKADDIRVLIEDTYGIKIGDTIYHTATGDSGIIVGFDCNIDTSGTLIQAKVSWAPDCVRPCYLEELTTERIYQ